MGLKIRGLGSLVSIFWDTQVYISSVVELDRMTQSGNKLCPSEMSNRKKKKPFYFLCFIFDRHPWILTTICVDVTENLVLKGKFIRESIKEKQFWFLWSSVSCWSWHLKFPQFPTSLFWWLFLVFRNFGLALVIRWRRKSQFPLYWQLPRISEKKCSLNAFFFNLGN